MKADLPTEEDVLAALVLAKAFDPPLLVFDVPGIVAEIAYQRHRTTGESWSAAIADSERRLAIEQARDAVVEAAREWGVRIFAGKKTNGDLLSAVCVLEAALMRCGAEVSRHGG